MPDQSVILAQVAPNVTTETDLFTVAKAGTARLDTLFVCNRGGATTFRASIRQRGGTTDPKDFLYYDTALAANATLQVTLDVTLFPTDIFRVYAGSATLTFTLFGQVT